MSNKEPIYSQTPEEQAIWEVGRLIFLAEADKQEAEAGWHSARLIGLAPIFLAISAGIWCGIGYAGCKIYNCFTASKDSAPSEQVISKPKMDQSKDIPVLTLPITLPIKLVTAKSPAGNKDGKNVGMGPRN